MEAKAHGRSRISARAGARADPLGWPGERRRAREGCSVPPASPAGPRTHVFEGHPASPPGRCRSARPAPPRRAGPPPAGPGHRRQRRLRNEPGARRLAGAAGGDHHRAVAALSGTAQLRDLLHRLWATLGGAPDLGAGERRGPAGGGGALGRGGLRRAAGRRSFRISSTGSGGRAAVPDRCRRGSSTRRRPPVAEGRRWAIRTTDLDVMGHVNNAAHWEAVEDELARRLPGRIPVAAECEYRSRSTSDTRFGWYRRSTRVAPALAGQRRRGSRLGAGQPPSPP